MRTSLIVAASLMLCPNAMGQWGAFENFGDGVMSQRTFPQGANTVPDYSGRGYNAYNAPPPAPLSPPSNYYNGNPFTQQPPPHEQYSPPSYNYAPPNSPPPGYTGGVVCANNICQLAPVPVPQQYMPPPPQQGYVPPQSTFGPPRYPPPPMYGRR